MDSKKIPNKIKTVKKNSFHKNEHIRKTEEYTLNVSLAINDTTEEWIANTKILCLLET